MLFKISNIGSCNQFTECIDSIKSKTSLDVVVATERDEWASNVAGREITSDNTYVALFGAGDVMIIQDAIEAPVVVDREFGKPRIRIIDRM